MIVLSDTFNPHASNAWGQTVPTRTRIVKIEKKDAGIRSHYRGYNYSAEIVYEGDIIAIYDYQGYTSWVFDQTYKEAEMPLHKTEDGYALFKKHREQFDQANTFEEFCTLANLSHLLPYVGGWIDLVFRTFKAGKETYRALVMPEAKTYSDLFKAAYFIPTDMKNKPSMKFLGGNAGLCVQMGGRRGWSERIPGVRSRYGSKFYGTYVVPIKQIDYKNSSFEAIRRTDGILIIVRSYDYCGEDWVALLDLDSNIEDLFDQETRDFLAAERQADKDAWEAGDARIENTPPIP